MRRAVLLTLIPLGVHLALCRESLPPPRTPSVPVGQPPPPRTLTGKIYRMFFKFLG